MTEAILPTAGQPAPDFHLPASGGSAFSLADLRGRKVILYFYPKDDTSGCTREALDFTALVEAFAEAGAAVLGVSRDPVAKHDRFIAKHGLGERCFPTRTARSAGATAPGSRSPCTGATTRAQLHGRSYMGIERATFLIDADGILRREWRKVKVPGHAEEVLAALRAL